MFPGENALRFDQLLVKVRKRQLRRQHCVLNIKEAVIAGGETARFGIPRFRARIGSIDADVDNLGNFQTPVTHDLKAFTVPRWISNDVDGYRDIQRTSILQRLEIFRERHAFAIAFQSFIINRFEPEKHGV